MRTRIVLSLFAALLLTAASPKPSCKPPFKPACTLPFAKIAAPQPIDTTCGMAGGCSSAPDIAAQAVAKNNFCATGTPVLLTFAAYPGLQAAAEKALDGPDYQPPLDRKILQKLLPWNGKMIGEGTVVMLVAFAESAHYSDVTSGESVNCNLKGDSNNDVHIPLVATRGADECTSVTAEISPPRSALGMDSR
jgi:hypothetical protein